MWTVEQLESHIVENEALLAQIDRPGDLELDVIRCEIEAKLRRDRKMLKVPRKHRPPSSRGF